MTGVQTCALPISIKFTPPGGRVCLRARLADGGLRLMVEDTGIGMSSADIPKALSPFGQIDSAHNRRHAGTGLGLPLTKRLVELHGGTLALDSVPGRGTTVTILFPASRIHAGPSLHRLAAANIHR